MASASEAIFCMATTPESDKTTQGKQSSKNKKEMIWQTSEKKTTTQKNRKNIQRRRKERLKQNQTAKNDFQEKEDDMDSPPSYIETPEIDENNHDNPHGE